MQSKHLIESKISHVFNLVLAGGFCMGGSYALQAAEKKTYTKPPVAAFSSQMADPLLGSDKYEKPVWNLHDALDLPKWLFLSVDQRTRYETMDGSFKADGKGGDQQIPLQTDVFLEHVSIIYALVPNLWTPGNSAQTKVPRSTIPMSTKPILSRAIWPGSTKM